MAAPAKPSWYERPPWRHVFEVNLSVFQAFLIIYLVLLLVETLREGAVTRFLPLNAILLVVLATGIAAVLTTKEKAEQEERPLRKRDYVLVGLIAVGAWLILWYQLRNLGWIQYPISLLGGLLVGLVSLSVLLPEPAAEAEPLKAPPRAAPVAATTWRFECPSCGLPGKLPSDKPSARLRCPRCKNVFNAEASKPAAAG